MQQTKMPHDTIVDKALEDTFPASDPAPIGSEKTREERARRDAEEKPKTDES